MTNFNERTNTLLYKNIISHTLFSKGLMLVVYERWVGDGDRLLHIDPQVLLTITALLFHLGRGCSTVGQWGSKPSVCSWFSLCWNPISNWLKPSVSWLYFCLKSTYFRLFTQVHLLIDGLVEGQYVTLEKIHKKWLIHTIQIYSENKPSRLIKDWQWWYFW